jgi:hypothetical protein
MINTQLTDKFNYHKAILPLMLQFESNKSNFYMSILKHNYEGGFLL